MTAAGTVAITGGEKYQFSPEQWRKRLSQDEFIVLRQGGTEAPFTGKYTDTTAAGIYVCRGCGADLFSSATKFASGCGWPAFFAPIDNSVDYLADHSGGRERTEVRCRACGSHLGHVFSGEGYNTPSDKRFCINSKALRLKADPQP